MVVAGDIIRFQKFKNNVISTALRFQYVQNLTNGFGLSDIALGKINRKLILTNKGMVKALGHHHLGKSSIESQFIGEIDNKDPWIATG